MLWEQEVGGSMPSTVTIYCQGSAPAVVANHSSASEAADIAITHELLRRISRFEFRDFFCCVGGAASYSYEDENSE